MGARFLGELVLWKKNIFNSLAQYSNLLVTAPWKLMILKESTFVAMSPQQVE